MELRDVRIFDGRGVLDDCWLGLAGLLGAGWCTGLIFQLRSCEGDNWAICIFGIQAFASL